MGIWTFGVAFLLCFCPHLQIVLAEKGFIGQNIPLSDWIESTGVDPADKVVDKWFYSDGRKALTTEVEPGAASWFITPQLNLPNTSYLDMEASCNMNPCQLEIYGTDNGSPTNRNHEFIQNITFGTQRLGQNTTIKTPYVYLCILARVLSTSAKTAFYIHSNKIHHYFCKETSKYTTELRKLDSSTTNISKHVPCPDNAVSTDGKSTNITANCTPEGNWIFGKCACTKGFYSNNEKCSPPIKIPVKPEVKEIKGSRNSVNITWLPPVNNNINETIAYEIKCNICTTNAGNKPCTGLSYNPSQVNVTKTYVRVSNLIHGQCYQFGIVATNSLNRVVSKDKWDFVSSDPYVFQSKGNRSNSLNDIIQKNDWKF